MILDTSALAAILFGEPEAALYPALYHAVRGAAVSGAMVRRIAPLPLPTTKRA